MIARSATVRASGPPMSCECDSGTMPSRLERPAVPRRPKRLLLADGFRIDPQVSLPMFLVERPGVVGRSRVQGDHRVDLGSRLVVLTNSFQIRRDESHRCYLARAQRLLQLENGLFGDAELRSRLAFARRCERSTC